MTRSRSFCAMVAVLVGSAVLAQPGAGSRGQAGGILHIAFSPGAGLDYVDPALSFTQPGWSLIDTTCARLFTYPDKPPPAGFRAAARGGLELEGLGRPQDLHVHAPQWLPVQRRKAAAGERLRPRDQPRASAREPIAGRIHMVDIVGAADVLAGRRQVARGVVARGDKLTVKFTRPAPDFLARTTLPYFCAVPPGLPASSEGKGAFPSAGPYYVQEYRENERVVIRRNPYYDGRAEGAPRRLRREPPRGLADTTAQKHRPQRGRLGPHDLGRLPRSNARPHPEVRDQPVAVVREQGLGLRMLAFNSSRPLFRNNPRLRRAINFALNREELLATSGGSVVARVTDQLLPARHAGIPGCQDLPGGGGPRSRP